MILYLEHSTDPYGGHLSASAAEPDPASFRRTVDEVRVVENFPDDVWALALAGGLPVDEDHSNDSTWLPWWDDAAPAWSRE